MKMNYSNNFLLLPKSKWSLLLLFFISVLTQSITTFAADPPCSPISTLPCNAISVGLPYTLNFNSSVANSITDKAGLGIGFTMVDKYSGTRLSADGTPSNSNVPGYEASKLTLSSGTLKIATNKGIASLASNNQLNTLGVKVDSRSKLQLDVTLVKPYAGTQFEQAGLWFGLSDKTFLKIVVTGNKVEMRKEINDQEGTDPQRVTSVISGLNTQTVRLRMVINPANNTLEGFYSTDGSNYINVGAAYSTKTINISGMGLTSSTAYAGIFATHRNASTSVTYTFDDFSVKSTTTNPNPNPLNSNAYLVLENPDKFPAHDDLVFSIVSIPWRRTTPTVTPYNRNHDRVKLKLTNKGSGTLVINNLTLSNTNVWKLDSLNQSAYSTSQLPIKLATGASAELSIRFTAKSLGSPIVLLKNSLTISSNDDFQPNKEVILRGLYQYKGEGSDEPSAQQIINAFGYKSRTGYGHNDGAIDGKTMVPNSDEVDAQYFLQADASKPVSVVQMGAYHGCCSTTEKIQWYDKATSTLRNMFVHDGLDGQSLLPRKLNSKDVAAATFNTSTPFGFRVGTAYSSRSKNFEGRFGMRAWKAIDENGNVIPNAYIIGTDYLGTEYTNYDYQDNVYFVSNVRIENAPLSASTLGSSPSALTFGTVVAGASKNLSVQVSNKSTGTNDPAIKITAVELVGPNAGEFAAVMPTTTTLGPKAAISVNVSFKPTSRGLKNAALMVHYNSGGISPLRIPLYGIANDAKTTISVVKRIKGAADANVTINGTTWEADKNYRKGSIKLDKQVTPGPIAATDEDVLYQTYLSAATNLAETRYEVPLANGTYLVRMHFVENFFNGPAGSRVFNTTIENSLRLSSFDIYREVGYRAALVKDFEVVVSDGVLTVKFNPTANRVAIAAMEIYRPNTASGIVTSVQDSNATMSADETASTVQVYPNPSRGSDVQTKLAGFTPQSVVDITVQDVMGRIIQTKQVTVDNLGEAQLVLPATLPAGLYLINAQSATNRAQAKLLVE